MQTQPELPRGMRRIVFLVSVMVLLSALAGAGLSVLLPLIMENQRTALALMGFEIVVAVAGALGILVASGRFGGAPGMALLCIGGTIFVGSVLGWQGAGRQMANVTLTPFMLLRVLAAFALIGLAAMATLRRDPGSWRPAIMGAALGLPVVLAAGAIVHPRGRSMLTGIIGDDVAVQAGLAVVGLLIFGGLLAASVHLLVGAFERAAGD